VKKEVVNELYYEQILLGELDSKNYDEESIDKSEILRIEQSNEDILKKYPARQMADLINDRMKKESETSPKIINFKKIYIPLTAAAVFLLFFTMIPIYKDTVQDSDMDTSETVRLKGNIPSLYIYRGNSANAELLNNNSLVKEKDLLQISYDSAGTKYGVIFSIDGRGTVTLHFPDNVYSNTRLDYGGKIYLPFSYELDNAPFFERFFFISSDSEIDASLIMENAGRIAKGNKSEMLILPQEFKQQSIILFKEEE